MESVFSYNSKFVQMLMKLADMIIMNLLFILLCIPIVTIGAAQSALFAGIRQMMNQEDDNSCIKAFFKGFASGFGKITIVHTVFLIIMALFSFLLYASMVYQGGAFTLPAILCIIVLAVCILFHSMLAPFHACFDCTAWQLARNMYFVVMAFILRSLAVAVLVWLPIGVALLDLYIFMRGLPIWSFLYYSVAYLFAFSLMKKPFEDLKKEFLDKQKEADSTQTAEAIEEEIEETV